jgi:hypothetical protein
MFITSCFSGTGFKCPVIADVNMDVGADIVVTNNANSHSVSFGAGYMNIPARSGRHVLRYGIRA